jgi:hypothetical protein
MKVLNAPLSVFFFCVIFSSAAHATSPAPVPPERNFVFECEDGSGMTVYLDGILNPKSAIFSLTQPRSVDEHKATIYASGVPTSYSRGATGYLGYSEQPVALVYSLFLGQRFGFVEMDIRGPIAHWTLKQTKAWLSQFTVSGGRDRETSCWLEKKW